MPYRLQSPISPADEVIRVAREQIGRIRAEIDTPDLSEEDKVHQVRKRCKKLRGLLRLIRPALGERYSSENARFRDIARELSAQRDADVLLETHDEIVSGEGNADAGPALQRVRELLRARSSRAEIRPAPELLAKAQTSLRHAEASLDEWLGDGELTLEDVSSGLEKTYRRGRKALARAYETASAEDFHEWRKRAKYHLYHLQLLQPIWSPVVKARRKQAKSLSDRLGDEHDLSVYLGIVSRLDDPSLDPEAIAHLQDLALRRRDELRAAAHGLGKRLWAEKPRRLIDRMEAYWNAWHVETLRSG